MENVSTENNNYGFMNMPVWKLIVMSVVSLNIYNLVWFYNQWKCAEKIDKTHTNPFVGAIFYQFSCFSLFSKIEKFYKRDDEKLHGVLAFPTLSALLFFILIVTGFILFNIVALGFIPEHKGGMFFIAVVCMFTYISMLADIQAKINSYNKKFNLLAAKNKWSVKSIIFTILAAIFFMSSVNGWVNVLSTKLSLQEQEKTGFTYAYTYYLSDGLEEYCKNNGYVPRTYLKNFDAALRNTKNKALENYNLLSKKDQKELLKIIERDKNSAIDNDYKNFLLTYPNYSRRDYCIYLDKNSNFVINNIIYTLKTNRLGMYIK